MHALALDICRKEGLNPSTIQPIAGGQVNHVFQIEDARAHDGYVLRIGARADAHRRLREETAILRRLEGQVPVPRVIAFGEHAGLPYQIQTYIPGQPLLTAWPGLSLAAQERVAAQLADAMQVLHAEQHAAFGPMGEESPHPSWAGQRAARFHAAIAELRSLGIRMAPGFIELASDYYAAHQDALEGGVPTLVHGDLSFSNILVEPDRDHAHVTAILDFEYALRAPADYELLGIEEFCLYPNDYAEEDNEIYTSADFASFCVHLRRFYPALFAIPRLHERLDLYHLEVALANYLAWRKDNLATIPPEQMDAGNFYMARITNFIFPHGARMF